MADCEFMWVFWILGILGSMFIGAGIGNIFSCGWGWLVVGILLITMIPLSPYIYKKADSWVD